MASAGTVAPAAMACPPLQSDSRLDGGPHGSSDIDAGHGATGAGREAGLVHGEGEGRTAEALLEPGRHEADDAGMPIGGGGDHHRRVGHVAERAQGLSFGLLDRLLLDDLPFAVEPVELGREPALPRRRPA
jgi:hypothetical protein